jgi:hypothetical protein
VLGKGLDQFPPELRTGIVARYPRKHFKEDFLKAYFGGFAHKPGTEPLFLRRRGNPPVLIHQLVEFIPDVLEEGKIYVSIEVVHKGAVGELVDAPSLTVYTTPPHPAGWGGLTVVAVDTPFLTAAGRVGSAATACHLSSKSANH